MRSATMRTCPHGKDDRLLLSGTMVRKTLSEGGDLPKEFSRPDVVAILQKYYQGLEEKIEVKLHLCEIAVVSIDVEEMKQVLRNLIGNAIDSMSAKDYGILSLRTEKVADGKKHVLFEISDTGCGIPPENIKKIYEPFFSTKSRGTGLGLAVVNRIIHERHKGVLDIKSKVGVGTTFRIELPI